MAQPGQLCGELSACNFCASLGEGFFWQAGFDTGFPDFWGKKPLGKRGCMGRWGAGAGITGDGGGTASEAWGSWKVRFNSARPPGSASSRKLAWQMAVRGLSQTDSNSQGWSLHKAIMY